MAESNSSLSLINEDLLAPQGVLAEGFRNARPFPHLVIDNFFSSDFCNRLLSDFPASDKGDATNEQGDRGGGATIEDLRNLGETSKAGDDLVRSGEFLALISKITGIPDLIYDPYYIGGGTQENRYEHALDPHIDQLFSREQQFVRATQDLIVRAIDYTLPRRLW